MLDKHLAKNKDMLDTYYACKRQGKLSFGDEPFDYIDIPERILKDWKKVNEDEINDDSEDDWSIDEYEKGEYDTKGKKDGRFIHIIANHCVILRRYK